MHNVSLATPLVNTFGKKISGGRRSGQPGRGLCVSCVRRVCRMKLYINEIICVKKGEIAKKAGKMH